MIHRISKPFLILLVLISASCKGTIPRWEGKIYAGDPDRGAVVRRQAGEVVSCRDPRFKAHMSMTYVDFESFYRTYVLGCKKWPQGIEMMTVLEAWNRLKAVTKGNRDEK